MGATILVAEDETDLRTMFRRILQHAGHTVLEAEDGIAAVELAAQHRPALILLDISMPRQDGLETVGVLRRGGFATTPIIALTAHAMPGDRERALAAGFTTYIPKPIDIPFFIAEVQRHLAAE